MYYINIENADNFKLQIKKIGTQIIFLPCNFIIDKYFL